VKLERVIRAERAVLPEGERAVAVGIAEGRIAVLAEHDAQLDAAEEIALGPGEVLLPGLVDTHVHVNEPGRTEWEGFATATQAAAAGGVTTIVDMPLNSIPPTVDVAALELKRKTAEPQAFVDVGFWGGAVPGNVPQLRPLHESGVYGFKCFLLHSGVEEFPPLDDEQLEAAMREIAGFDGLLIVHAEDAGCIDGAPEPHGAHYADFLSSRPREAENQAVARVIGLARTTGCRVHVLHVSSAEALPLIADARRAGVRISAETCPHYLTFTAEEIPDGATAFKCCPPIREADNREQLWQGLRDGVLDIVVSDHSPSTVDLKALDSGDFGVAWGGISSLQVGLAAVWTGARERGLPLTEVVRWMSAGPARLVGLPHKGGIVVGADADFCVLAPEEEFVVDVRALHHRNAITPYDGRTLHGVVHSTWLRGERMDLDDAERSAGPRGRLLSRGD
jgi:allantoinase